MACRSSGLAGCTGFAKLGRVYGPDLMLAYANAARSTGHRHFFYGGAPGVADLLRQASGAVPAPEGCRHYTHRRCGRRIVRRMPGCSNMINATSADIVWVGLGTPKQDFWVSRHRPLLSASALIAVGAAFDFHAGLLQQAPRWMQRNGLEWLFRLLQEPRRLAYRYSVYNPLFVLLVILQAMKVRTYS